MTKTVYRGQVRAQHIGVQNPGGVGTWGDKLVFVKGREYLLLVRPSKDSARTLLKVERSTNYRDALPKDEIVAVVELQ